MDIAELQERAPVIRSQYALEELRRYGRSWTPEEIMLGFLGDVGDLAKLVQGKAGIRERDDLDSALAHELADCLWSIFTLADCYARRSTTALPDLFVDAWLTCVSVQTSPASWSIRCAWDR